MTFRVDQYRAKHRVIDEDGTVKSEHDSPGDANRNCAALNRELAARREAERTQKSNDPANRQRRREKAAYRLVECDPYLSLLKRVLPRKGEAERNTLRSYERMMKWMDGHVSFASSDPNVHAMLNRTSAQRQTANATRSRGEQGDASRERLRALWLSLTEVPERRRAAHIAKHLGITADHVRRVVRYLKKEGAIR